MSFIPDDLVERVRDAADIVEIIGEEVNLRRTGADYRGPCPFHGGTKRNFSVIPRKQMFYCFVCHEGGDVFTYFMKRHGLEYPKAVREIASRVGIEIPDRPTGGADPNERLYSAVSVAAEWYARRLREDDDAARARQYLVDRAFDLERLLPVGLGWAPKGNAFLEGMETLGIRTDVLREAGLAVEREDGTLRPRFWGRLLFPIHDLRGRAVGFGGRLLGDGEPKYLNSPESRIFHKGQLLYNLHAAKHAIRKAGRAIAVEGYFDVIRMVDAGVENVVAGQGTAFTPDQAALLKRYAPEVVLFYDSDPAGLRASFRAADELLRAGVRTFIATPPSGEDPDSLVKNGGAAALEKILDDAIDVFERKLQLLERKGWLGTLAGKRRALDRLLPTLRAVKDPITRDLYVQRAAEALGIQAESIRREMEGAARPSRPPGPPTAARVSVLRRGTAEWRLLEVMVREPEWRPRVPDILNAPVWSNPAEQELFDALKVLPETIGPAELFDRLSAEAQAILAELLAQPWEPGLDVDAIVAGEADRLKTRAIDEKIRERERRLPLVPAGSEKDALVREIGDLAAQKRQLKRLSWFR